MPVAGINGSQLAKEEDSQVISQIVEEIAQHEEAAGRPMLRALVTHRGDDNTPGEGFVDVAWRLGLFKVSRNEFVRLKFWMQQVEQVHNHWQNE